MPPHRYASAAHLTAEERNEASEVLRVAHIGCDENEQILLAVHSLLEQVRARARDKAQPAT
jgi:hypothetical protein